MIFREIFRYFLVMERPLAHQFNEVICSLDLTMAQWKTLDFIEKSGTCALVEISRHLSTKKPPVTITIDSLEQKRFVEQIPGKDRREKRVRLTDLGREVYGACRTAIDEIEHHLLNGLSDEEQEILLRALTTVWGNLKSGGRSK